MTDSETDNPLKKSVEHELSIYESILAKAKSIFAIVPHIEEMKEEAEAKLDAINELPLDMLAELTPRLLAEQNWHLDSMGRIDRSIPKLNPRMVTDVSASGSTATMSSAVIEAFPAFESRPIWANHVIDRFEKIADIKSKRDSLPEAISALAKDLGEEFIQAEESVRKAKAGLLQPHEAASSMRNVIQRVWGELVNRARSMANSPSTDKRWELKKPAHRAEISRALASEAQQLRLEYLLELLYGVYQDLSRLSKKMSASPMKVLHDLRIRWILTLDSLRPFFPSQNIAVA